MKKKLRHHREEGYLRVKRNHSSALLLTTPTPVSKGKMERRGQYRDGNKFEIGGLD